MTYLFQRICTSMRLEISTDMMFLSIANEDDEDTGWLSEDKADPLFCAVEEKPPAWDVKNLWFFKIIIVQFFNEITNSMLCEPLCPLCLCVENIEKSAQRNREHTGWILFSTWLIRHKFSFSWTIKYCFENAKSATWNSEAKYTPENDFSTFVIKFYTFVKNNRPFVIKMIKIKFF